MVSIPHRQSINCRKERGYALSIGFQYLIGGLSTTCSITCRLSSSPSFNTSQVVYQHTTGLDAALKDVKFQYLIGSLSTMSISIQVPSSSSVSIPHRQSINLRTGGYCPPVQGSVSIPHRQSINQSRLLCWGTDCVVSIPHRQSINILILAREAHG